ncbi:MAG: hypothetical protein ABIO61_00250 [Thermomonas sp.]
MNSARLAMLGIALVTTAASAASQWHVPVHGSAERAQIMDALRTKLRAFDDSQADTVFVVRSLCVSDRLGWLDVLPRSRDGSNQYEPTQAVLVRRKGTWQVAKLACSEEECEAGTDAASLQREVGPQCG